MDDYEELKATMINNIACAEEEAKDLRDIIEEKDKRITELQAKLDDLYLSRARMVLLTDEEQL